ncbi:beta-mannosidase [Phlebotomus argentipes]|uniref:beta-mannosidase n=1 Tax=Phlebotomus argentipes TaxID=94469 RepID=UPI0028936E0D|nr:beta-mannosidase [Phlebotomus argentipes]
MSCLWYFGAMSSAATMTLLVLYLVASTSSSQIVLNTGWSLHSENTSISINGISLPSGVYSALQDAGYTNSVLHSYNDVQLRWAAMDNWAYSVNFTVTDEVLAAKHIILTLHGVDTVAEVYLNGFQLATVDGKVQLDNMFTRYRFDVKQLLVESIFERFCTVTVRIKSPVIYAKYLAGKHPTTPPECPPNVYNGECHMNFLRKMQASFSWDWGPAVPSSGLWRPVVLEYYNSVVIRDITVQLEEDRAQDLWNVHLVIYLEAGSGVNDVKGTLKLTFVDFPGSEKSFQVDEKTDASGELALTASLDVPRSDAELWWPNGYGRQKLYVLQAIFDPGNIPRTRGNAIVQLQQEQVSKSIKVGFRTIELVQEETPDNGGKGLSFYFRVNGVAIFMKGTNWIPSSILPEKSFSMQHVKHLLKAVKTSHMNMIRVWGGGLYEDDRFYELTDTYGILIWHDLMFACAMYPVFPDFLASVQEEVRQNVRRIQSHPSVAIWATNNENEVALVQNWYHTGGDRQRFEREYRQLYIDVVKKEVEIHDPWRECLSSSPSNGRQTEADNWISKDPQDWHFGDIHYYNYDLDAWNPSIYPRPRFVSEYGFQSLPSLNAFESILAPKDNISEMINHRQHSPLRNFPIDGLIKRHLPLETLSGDPKEVLEAYIFFSQVSQAMAVKTETEVYRAGRIGPMNTMGALFWQLNDVWVAPSWSSIELNGNYKILQHWVKQFMAPLHIIPLVDPRKNLRIYVVRDSLGETQKLTVRLHLHHWAGFDVKLEKSWSLDMLVELFYCIFISRIAPNPTKKLTKLQHTILTNAFKSLFQEENTAVILDTLNFVDIFGSEVMEKSGFLYFLLEDASGRLISTNFIFPEKLRDAQGIVNPHIDVVVASNRCSFSVSQISLEVKARAPAIFVYIQINNPDIKSYSLSKNGYIQLEPIHMIRLEFANENCATTLQKRDIRILTINDYLKTTQ